MVSLKNHKTKIKRWLQSENVFSASWAMDAAAMSSILFLKHRYTTQPKMDKKNS